MYNTYYSARFISRPECNLNGKHCNPINDLLNAIDLEEMINYLSSLIYVYKNFLYYIFTL